MAMIIKTMTVTKTTLLVTMSQRKVDENESIDSDGEDTNEILKYSKCQYATG